MIKQCQYNGIDFYTCAYLYDNNIIYLSTNEHNPYSSLQEVADIIKKQYPQMNIFGINYSNNNNTKLTKRLARKIE